MRALPALFGLVAASGCAEKDGGEVPVDRTESVLSLTGDPAGGAPLYDEVCAICHGTEGEGGVGNPLAPVVSEELFAFTVIEGRPTQAMPAFGDDYSDQQVADLLAHVHTLSGVPLATP